MTLRRKMSFQIGAMMIGLLLVCAAALWGVSGLRSDFGIALLGNRELREMYEVAAHVDKARTLLAVGNRDLAATEIDRALTKWDLAISRETSGSALRQSEDGPRLAAAFRDAIKRAQASFNCRRGTTPSIRTQARPTRRFNKPTAARSPSRRRSRRPSPTMSTLPMQDGGSRSRW